MWPFEMDQETELSVNIISWRYGLNSWVCSSQEGKKNQDVWKRSLKYAKCAGGGEEGGATADPRWCGQTDELEMQAR